MSVAWAAYRLMAPALGALAPAARLFSPPAERPLWGERMGRVTLEGGCEAWVHAASLGEAGAAGTLVHELARVRPEARLYLTATTRSGRARLQSLGHPVSLAPIDSPQAVERFLSGVRPARLFVVETELWPQWLLRVRTARMPAAVVSARLSERSVEGYLRLGLPMRRLVGSLEAVLCQSPVDETRWLAIGARRERTVVVGNLKHDALPEPVPDRAAARAALGLAPERPLLVLGSVRPGEVRILARAWRTLDPALRDRWQVVAVPRHARAARGLRGEAAEGGVVVATDRSPARDAWRWDDRAGVLNAYYAAAEVAFVGGSLAPHGGHNPLEPAACGAALLMGPHHASQADAVAALERRDALWEVEDEAAARSALGALLGSPAVRELRARAASEVVQSQRGAGRRAVRWLCAWGLWPVG